MPFMPHPLSLPIPSVSWKLAAARTALIAGALAVWFATQAMLGGRPALPVGGPHDLVHVWTAPWHAWLLAHPDRADALLIASSLGIDFLGVTLMLLAVFGRSLRPFAGLLVLFILRQLCQMVCVLPPPEGMIWHNPGFPSLLVTYGVASDLFFSGHTALAIFGCLELARLGRPWLALAIPLAVFEIVVVLVLRAHWTADVFAGALAALWVGSISERLAHPADRMLCRLERRKE